MLPAWPAAHRYKNRLQPHTFVAYRGDGDRYIIQSDEAAYCHRGIGSDAAKADTSRANQAGLDCLLHRLKWLVTHWPSGL